MTEAIQGIASFLTKIWQSQGVILCSVDIPLPKEQLSDLGQKLLFWWGH